MKKNILKKLKDKSGETIGEVLVALLISSLALVMLASMISATQNMVTRSKTKMNEYYQANEVLETMSSGNAEDIVSNFSLTITGHENGEAANDLVIPEAGSSLDLTCYKNTKLGKTVYAYVLN